MAVGGVNGTGEVSTDDELPESHMERGGEVVWRLYTRGWGPSGWWRWVKESAPMWAAFWLPRRVALWAFIRVYAADGEGPGPEYSRVYDAWESGRGN